MSYRPDIDGLRAVAVLSVIAFHINDKLLPGGFVGVDIFFVISGYLISLHIMVEIRSDRFSIAEFYRRRIKRIAPAMLIVLGVTFLLAQFLFRPEDAEDTARAAFWSLMSLANVFFWLFQDTSYFAANSNELPLLHLWSLGVEEQFYLLWPLVLLASYKNSRPAHYGITMFAVAVASFWFGQYYFSSDPSFVYYMLPARAGELLVGAIAAHHVCTEGDRTIHSGLVQTMAVVGGILVIGSLFLVSEQAPFPGYQAIPPTIGTTMLILAGHYGKSWPTGLLRLQPMVWVGLVSYSAYLWHWPILAFLHYGGFEIGFQLGAAVLLMTMVLAWLTFRFVEQPFRRSQLPFIQVALRQYALPAVVIGAAAVVSLKTDGFAFHWLSDDYENRIAEVRDTTRPAFEYDYVCQKQRVDAKDLEDPVCVVGAESDAVPEAILWGDSNAAHYIGMLGAFAKESGFSFRNIEVGACPPLRSDVEGIVTEIRLNDCRHSNRNIWESIGPYRTVILSASWTGYQARSERFLQATKDTVLALVKQDKNVLLIGKAPVIDSYDRRCREKAASFPFMDCQMQPVPISPDVVKINLQLRRFAEKHARVEYFDANQYLCPDGQCPVFDESLNPVYFDSHHLTLRSSWELGARIIGTEGVPRPFSAVIGTLN